MLPGKGLSLRYLLLLELSLEQNIVLALEGVILLPGSLEILELTLIGRLGIVLRPGFNDPVFLLSNVVFSHRRTSEVSLFDQYIGSGAVCQQLFFEIFHFSLLLL
jgi:hypothetical protein